jgi:transposase IS66 family protein
VPLAHRAATIPLLDAFFAWAQATDPRLSARSELAQALHHIITRRTALTRFATDARLEPDNNIAENACAASLSADAIGYSLAAMPAASAPPRRTRSCRPRN